VRLVLVAVRYGIPGVLFGAGVILLAVDPHGRGAEGFGLFGGCAVAILLLNVLFRFGAGGDEEREEEERAREHFREHGRWPGDHD
jgi:hypothetical protein